MNAERVRTAVRVEGIVQGVGFRPFVYSLAAELGLAGLVGNDADGVFIEVEGAQQAVDDFLEALRTKAPPLASIDRITTASLPSADDAAFRIVPSDASGERRALVSADAATCADCLDELGDPADRRFGYPFINCTNCGPRFTIIRDVPYDRSLTTMASFEMCELCAAEYHDPGNRRFHAQPTCCPECGPRLWLTGPGGDRFPGDPIAAAARLLIEGKILAIKGLGGYHLAADATSQEAAATLRSRKHREDKPFAVMAADLAAAGRLCHLDQTAAEALTSRRSPIVLLQKRLDSGPELDSIAEAVAPANRQLGVMLPYTPLHHLLTGAVARPIVLTSGNISDEPIAYTDDDTRDRLAAIADAFLGHDRAIHLRTDDSVVRPFRGRESVLRRSRGYAPEPVRLPFRLTRPVLACGAELKNTFCLGKGDRAVISQHIGDLENAATLRAFTEGIEHLGRLFDIKPELIAHDLHPDYLSTKYAIDLADRYPELELIGIQHHHAHIASCLADNGSTGPVIGVAFDGTGYGTDGTIWGGEFLVGDLTNLNRAAHLTPVPMPGGAAAIRQPWRMAAAYLDAAYPDGDQPQLQVQQRNADQWAAVTSMARKAINSPLTSSAGRLFDAVAAILGVRDRINYEGQAAIELEQLAAPAETGRYPVAATTDAATELIRAIVDDLGTGVPKDLIAARFHNTVARIITVTCVALRNETNLRTVALSGGVFQNLLLLSNVVDQLETRDFRVLTHSQVPCNDGGISLGQAAIAAARDRGGGQGGPGGPGGQAKQRRQQQS
ncbi:MAG TPA: carbamoyltransferase HypF [Streptosporangiaceae bacterium]|nr:carbamoyltransferase HypF [Streptosporangiaceae bacterium]